VAEIWSAGFMQRDAVQDQPLPIPLIRQASPQEKALYHKSKTEAAFTQLFTTRTVIGVFA
jgi:hypothetical protein